MWYSDYDTLLMAIDIRKPSAPITRSPMAETFEIVLNSSIVGFLRSRHTRRYLWYWDEIFLVSFFTM
jgi:hypothetical protein